MILRVTKLGHPVLRRKTREMAAEELAKPETQTFIDHMVDTMRDYDGVGLAANQVFQGLALAVLEVKEGARGLPAVPLTVLVNPVIVNRSKETEDDWEGCLSVPNMRGLVPRAVSVTVNALDRKGSPIQIHAEGFHARVIQHELDHLQGFVYLDRMPDLRTLTHLKEFARYWIEKD